MTLDHGSGFIFATNVTAERFHHRAARHRWIKQALERLADACSGIGPGSDCPILEAFEAPESGDIKLPE